MFEAEMWFSGCSCGCTPSERVKIRADNEGDLNRACARWALDFRTEGSFPFSKVRGIPASAKPLCEEAASRAIEIYEIRESMDNLRWKKKSILERAQEKRDALTLLGIEMPDKTKKEIEEIEREAALEDPEIERLREIIVMKTIELDEMLANEAEIIEDQEEDDDE